MRALFALLAWLCVAGAAVAQMPPGTYGPGPCPFGASSCQVTPPNGTAAALSSWMAGLGLNFTIGQSSLAVVAGGSGYATGERVTLACPGVTFSSAPIVGIWNVSTGVVAGAQTLAFGGVTIGPPTQGASVTCTQASTTGTGTGATFSAIFGPIAAGFSISSLAVGNGNLFINNWEQTAKFAGSESTFFGDKAGAGFSGSNAYQETAFGHNACGNGGSNSSAPQTVCVGVDAGRNAQGTDDGDVWLGAGAGRNFGGSTGFNTGTGWDSVGHNQTNSAGRFTGSWDHCYGAASCREFTTASGNIIVGPETTLTTGNDNIGLIAGHSGSPACDFAAAATSNTLIVCLGSTAVITTTGGGTPGTSITTIAGSLVATGGNAAAGGFTLSPRTVGTCQGAANVAYTAQTPVATEFYVAEVRVPANVTVTGVAVYNSATISGNVKVGLANSSGANVATSASTAMSGTSAYQLVPFTGTYAAVGPATYYVEVFYDNATARPNTFTAGACGVAKATGQVFATGFTTISAPTTFTTALGPVATLY